MGRYATRRQRNGRPADDGDRGSDGDSEISDNFVSRSYIYSISAK